MKLSFDLPATVLLYFSMPNFFSFVGIALAIVNQLYRMSDGVIKEGGFKPYFSKLSLPYIIKLKEWTNPTKKNG